MTYLLMSVAALVQTVCWGSSMSGVVSTEERELNEEYIAHLNSILSFDLGGHIYERASTDEPPLGQGSTGVVYRAVQMATGEPVALKCAYPSYLGTPGTMLAGEVSIVKSLEGYWWNLDLVDYGSSPGEFECAAFKRGGKSVAHHFKGRALSDCQMLDVIDKMLGVLVQLHAAGVTHGDTQMANWLLENPNDLSTLKLIDFGMAVRISNPSSPPDQVIADFMDVRDNLYEIRDRSRAIGGFLPAINPPANELPSFLSATTLVANVRSQIVCAMEDSSV